RAKTRHAMGLLSVHRGMDAQDAVDAFLAAIVEAAAGTAQGGDADFHAARVPVALHRDHSAERLGITAPIAALGQRVIQTRRGAQWRPVSLLAPPPVIPGRTRAPPPRAWRRCRSEIRHAIAGNPPREAARVPCAAAWRDAAATGSCPRRGGA